MSLPFHLQNFFLLLFVLDFHFAQLLLLLLLITLFFELLSRLSLFEFTLTLFFATAVSLLPFVAFSFRHLIDLFSFPLLRALYVHVPRVPYAVDPQLLDDDDQSRLSLFEVFFSLVFK